MKEIFMNIEHKKIFIAFIKFKLTYFMQLVNMLRVKTHKTSFKNDDGF